MLMLPIDDYRVRQRDFLLEISRAITAQLDLSEVLRRVLHASLVMLRGQVGLIALRSADDFFRVRALSGMESDHVPSLNDHLNAFSERIHQGASKEEVNDLLNQMATAISPELEQAVALPLKFADDLLGVMIVFRNYTQNAALNDMQVIQSFADQAAIAVHNAQLYERIDQERRGLAAILQNSADGVMILSPDLRILRFNRALERMTGWDKDDAIGRFQDEIIRWSALEDGDLNDAIADGWPYTLSASNHDESPLYVEGDLMRQDDMTVSIGITYAPMFKPDGQLTSIIANVRDISNFRQAQEIQNTFISVVSHELKTPVAIIKGYAATLNRPDARWDESIMRETANVIEEEADRLNGLIQNLLDATRLQAQHQMKLDISEVAVDALLERSVERFRMQTSLHNLILNLPETFPMVTGDGVRLRQVIDNLIGNAIKYSPAGGTITISAHYDEHSVSVSVRDEGVGLSSEDQKRVFDRFYRVDGKLTRKTQGTGLGLFLARSIIEAHGGAITVESRPGEGSTFYFTIPR